MQFLRWLATLRTPFFDVFFSLLTHLGEEAFFLVLALLLFWCVDKRRGYTLLVVGFCGLVCNQFLKLLFRIPRPWVLDPCFSPVADALPGATGYSFPSGHTQNAACLFGCVAMETRYKTLRIVSIALIGLIAFSRMYLGVHTPLDVGVSLAIGLVLVGTLVPLIRRPAYTSSTRALSVTLGIMGLISLALVLFTSLYPFPAGTEEDARNIADGIKTAYTLLGCTAALWIGSLIDNRYIRFSTEAPILGQTLKLGIGTGLVLFIKSVLKAPLLALCGEQPLAHSIRYFILILFVCTVWPLTFRFFAKCGKRHFSDMFKRKDTPTA